MINSPDVTPREAFTDPAAAVARLQELYQTASKFLCNAFTEAKLAYPPQKCPCISPWPMMPVSRSRKTVP